MTREEVLRRLSEHRPGLVAPGVRALDLFGSFARGEGGPRSDVDFLVEFDRPVGPFHFFRVQQRIELLPGRPVDPVMQDAIKSRLRAQIMAEAMSVT